MDHYYRLQNGGGTEHFSFTMPGFSASIVTSRYIGEMIFEHCEPNHRILVTLSGGTSVTYAQAQGAAPVDRPDKAGSVTIVPAGTRRSVLLRDGDISLLSVAIAPDFASDCGAIAEVPLAQNGRDDWLWRAGAAFQNAAAIGRGTLGCEGLAIALARHLRRLSGAPGRVPTGLDPAALTRVLALMRDRLGENLSLVDLAIESGLSISAFSRAFRHATGITPHRYFTIMRMQQAKALLRKRNLPLASVADAVGYSDQAHFTTAFARHTGLPPARWRQTLLG
jgi:AraC-like DNA-binding protein